MNATMVECPACLGEGKVEAYTLQGRANYQTEILTCDVCNGSGEIEDEQPAPLRTTDEDPEPLLLQVLESYDPEHDSAVARVTRTDFLIAEAVTTLQSMVEGQALEIQALKEALAKLMTLQY